MAYCTKCKTDIGNQTLEDHLPDCDDKTLIDKLLEIIDEATKNKDKEDPYSKSNIPK